MKLRTSLLHWLLAFGLYQAGAVHADTPRTDLTPLCTLDESCAVEGPALVAFGSQDHYTYRTLSGEFICDGRTFNVEKAVADAACFKMDPGASSTSSDAASSDEASTASSEDGSPITSGLYAIISRSSGKALEVGRSATGDGANITQSDFVQAPNQIWQLKEVAKGYYALVATHSGKALEVKDWAVQDGARLQQFPWINSWTQHWQLESVEGGYFRLVSRFNNKVVDVYELNRKNGGDVRTWTYWGGENQQWSLVPITDAPKSQE